MSFDNVTRAIIIRNIKPEFVGEHKITIELTDRYGGYSVQEFRFHLKEVPLSELKPPGDEINKIIQEATSWAKSMTD